MPTPSPFAGPNPPTTSWPPSNGFVTARSPSRPNVDRELLIQDTSYKASLRFTNHAHASQTLTIFYRNAILGSYAGYAGKLASRSSEQPRPRAMGASTRVGGSDERVWSTLGKRNSPNATLRSRLDQKFRQIRRPCAKLLSTRARKAASLAAGLKPACVAIHHSAQSTCKRRSPLAPSGIGRTGRRRGAYVACGAGCRRLVTAEGSATGHQYLVPRASRGPSTRRP